MHRLSMPRGCGRKITRQRNRPFPAEDLATEDLATEDLEAGATRAVTPYLWDYITGELPDGGRPVRSRRREETPFACRAGLPLLPRGTQPVQVLSRTHPKPATSEGTAHALR